MSESWYLFRAAHTDEYMAHISRYRDWAVRATEASDVFTKETGKARSMTGISLKFEFHSGSASAHQLPGEDVGAKYN